MVYGVYWRSNAWMGCAPPGSRSDYLRMICLSHPDWTWNDRDTTAMAGMFDVHCVAMFSHIRTCVQTHLVLVITLTLKGAFGQSNYNMLENNGGHFRFGNIRRRRLSGNNVEFTLETSWRRDFGSTYWQGRGPDGLAIRGRYSCCIAKSRWITTWFIHFEMTRHTKHAFVAMPWAVYWNWLAWNAPSENWWICCWNQSFVQSRSVVHRFDGWI